MRLKKTKKAKKMRGSRLHGYAEKKHKGSGNRGGKGMSGTGKRGDQRKTWIIKHKWPYFGKKGFTSKKTAKAKNKIINIGDIQNHYKPGEINLNEYKLLGAGEVKDKFIIKVKSASKSAINKIEKAGGKIELVKEKIINIKKTNAEPNVKAGKSGKLPEDKKQTKQPTPTIPQTNKKEEDK